MLLGVKGKKMPQSESAQQVRYHVETQLDTAIQKIYRFSRTCNHAQFKQQALHVIRDLVNCDCAYWATVIDVSKPEFCSLYSSIIDASPNNSNEKGAAFVLDSDTLTPELEALVYSQSDWKLGESFIANMNDSLNKSNTNVKKNDTSSIQCLNNICDHLLITIEKNPQTLLHDVLVLQRGDLKGIFTEDERILKQKMIPHIIEAYQINLMYNTLSNDYSTHTAICDLKGNILHADNYFTNTLLSLHEESNGKRIPPDVFDSLLNSEPQLYPQRKIMMKGEIVEDIMFIYFMEDRRCSNLSGNERIVTKYLIQGHNHVDMANKLELPVPNIHYIVNCVYKKLGIKNKAELYMKFSNTLNSLPMPAI